MLLDDVSPKKALEKKTSNKAQTKKIFLNKMLFVCVWGIEQVMFPKFVSLHHSEPARRKVPKAAICGVKIGDYQGSHEFASQVKISDLFLKLSADHARRRHAVSTQNRSFAMYESHKTLAFAIKTQSVHVFLPN